MAGFQIKIEKFWAVFYEHNGYNRVLTGLKNTVLIAALGLVIGVFIGTLVATLQVLPKDRSANRVLARLARFYVALFRGTPIVVQLLIFYYVLLPLIGLNLSSLQVCILVFGLNSGAYVSEIMRGGIQSVDPGQMEAARAVGLGFGTSMIKIVVPQAVKHILPSIGNEFIALIKETSIVSFVGALDLYVAFNYIGTNNYEFMVPYLVMAMVYILLVMAITAGVRTMERHLAKSDRSH